MHLPLGIPIERRTARKYKIIELVAFWGRQKKNIGEKINIKDIDTNKQEGEKRNR